MFVIWRNWCMLCNVYLNLFAIVYPGLFHHAFTRTLARFKVSWFSFQVCKFKPNKAANQTLKTTQMMSSWVNDDVMKWKHFPRYWPFVREFVGPRWIPHTKASDAELWCFFDLRLNKRLSKQSWGWWFKTPSRPLWCHRNESMEKLYLQMWLTVAREVVTVMILLDLSNVLSEVAIEHHIMSCWYPSSQETNKEGICSQCVMKIPQITISNITTPADPGITRHCSWHCSSISLLPTSEMWQLLLREPPVRGYGHINGAELGVLFV